MLAGEMEVDGDLNVSGDIQSPTIAQLQEIIAQLEAQIALMQDADNKLETRVYLLPRIEFQSGDWYDLDIQSITGFELDYAQIKIAKVTDYFIDNNYASTNLMASYTDYNGNEHHLETVTTLHRNGSVVYSTAATDGVIYSGTNEIDLKFEVSNGWADFIITITAQFPETRSQK